MTPSVIRWWRGLVGLFIAVIDSTRGKTIRIGTRTSQLALIQAETVAKVLVQSNPSLDAPTIVLVSASGDSFGGVQDVPLALRAVDFTGMLDQALQSGEIDLAVHSLKDIPPSHRWHNSQGFVIACPLPREDPADVLLGPYQSLSAIPLGAKIGTSSIRRQAQLLSECEDKCQVVNIRGNIDARCQAMEEGVVDALILANAGLNRLKSAAPYTRIPTNVMIPGVCQGIVGAVYHKDNAWALEKLLPEDEDAAMAACAERAFLDSLDKFSPWPGRPPLAGLLERNKDEEFTFHGLLARPDGSKVLRASAILSGDGTKIDAAQLGKQVGLELLDKAGSAFFD